MIAAIRHRVMAALSRWLTAQNPPDSQPDAFYHPMFLNCLSGKCGTGGLIAALTRPVRGDRVFIDFDKEKR